MTSLSAICMPVFLGSIPDGAQLTRQWLHLYDIGHKTAPPIALGTFGLYVYSALSERAAGKPWELLAAAGVTTLSIVPYTLLTMLPTNHELMRLEKKGAAGEKLDLEETRRLARKWTWLHLVRSLFSLAGALLGVASAWS